jgi:threonine/homoserine/homoserine lactone efflux protein
MTPCRAVAVGLSALLVSSALAFAIIKDLSAAYLIWIGIRTLMAKDPNPERRAVLAEPLRRVCRDGFVVNLLNPKTAIFFLAVLPQFVDPARGTVHWQIFILGLTFMGLGILRDEMFAQVAGLPATSGAAAGASYGSSPRSPAVHSLVLGLPQHWQHANKPVLMQAGASSSRRGFWMSPRTRRDPGFSRGDCYGQLTRRNLTFTASFDRQIL